jgi:hypothetical protein
LCTTSASINQFQNEKYQILFLLSLSFYHLKKYHSNKLFITFKNLDSVKLFRTWQSLVSYFFLLAAIAAAVAAIAAVIVVAAVELYFIESVLVRAKG